MERGIGPGAVNWFFGEIMNRGDGQNGKPDSTQSGRVQVRIHGKHKDIQDSDLPWAMPLMPMGSGASNGGVGKAPIGLKNGSTVFGMFADAEQTIPIILGILHKAGSDSGGNGTTLNSKENDVPEGARTGDTGGGDKNRVLGVAVTGDELAKKGQLHKSKKTFGSSKFSGSEALDDIQKADSQNESGSIQPALNACKTMLDTLGQAGGMGGLMDSFSSILGGNMDIGSFLSQAQGLIGQVQGMAGGSGGGGGGGGGSSGTGITPTTTPATTPSTVSNTTTMVGGLIIKISYKDKETTATYADKKQDITVSLITTATNSYGGILNMTGSIKSIDLTKKPPQTQVAKNLKISDLLNKAANISNDCVSVFEACKEQHISHNLITNAFNNTSSPPPSPNSGGGGGGGGGGAAGFMGPMQSIMSMMGGLSGMTSMEQDNTSLEGPLTKNFTAAVQTASTLKGLGKSSVQGAGNAEIPSLSDITSMLGGGELGNIAGILDSVAGGDIGSIVTTALGAVQKFTGGGGGTFNSNSPITNFGSLTPTSLNNSFISLPASSPNVIRKAGKQNPGFGVDYAPELSPTPSVKDLKTTSGVVIPNYKYNSATANINSLNNSNISVNIPPVLTSSQIQNAFNKNPGINYELLGTLYAPLGE